MGLLPKEHEDQLIIDEHHGHAADVSTGLDQPVKELGLQHLCPQPKEHELGTSEPESETQNNSESMEEYLLKVGEVLDHPSSALGAHEMLDYFSWSSLRENEWEAGGPVEGQLPGMDSRYADPSATWHFVHNQRLEDKILDLHCDKEQDVAAQQYVDHLLNSSLAQELESDVAAQAYALNSENQILESHDGAKLDVTAYAPELGDQLLYIHYEGYSDMVAYAPNVNSDHNQPPDWHNNGYSDMVAYSPNFNTDQNQPLNFHSNRYSDMVAYAPCSNQYESLSSHREGYSGTVGYALKSDQGQILATEFHGEGYSDIVENSPSSGQNRNEDIHVDTELEKYLIVTKMLGNTTSIDPALEADLEFFVGVHESFRTGIPQHCRLECLSINDPAECCWNAKFSKAQSNPKKAVQMDITNCLMAYLKAEKKRVYNLPLHCTEVLRKWTKLNHANPYMSKTQALKIANQLGLKVTQVNHWLENWRARKWNPIPVGQTGRKGKHFRHPKEDTNKLKKWILEMGRHPTPEETKILSNGSSMTPDQIRMWCCNFRKRNKNLFVTWRQGSIRDARGSTEQSVFLGTGPFIVTQESMEE